MKRTLTLLTLLALSSLFVNAQDESYPIYTFGINYGFDQNVNAFKSGLNSKGNTFSKGGNPYSIGVDLGVMATKRVRPRLELRFVQMNYKVGWDNTHLASMIKESEVKLFNFDINLRTDFLLLGTKKFNLFISPAIKWEFNTRKECRNDKIDGSDNYKLYAGYSDVDDQFTKSTLGGAASMIFKYNVTPKIGITLTPEYTYFFNKFVKANSDPYYRYGVNFGLEYRFE
jgi:hypothetical protein